MRPRKTQREQHRTRTTPEREASVYIRTVLESVRDVNYLSSQDLREPYWESRGSGGADRLRLRWLTTLRKDDVRPNRNTRGCSADNMSA